MIYKLIPRFLSNIMSRYKLIRTRAGLCVFGILLVTSYQSNAAWLSICASQPLSTLNKHDDGYLAHILDAEEKVTLLRVTAIQPENSDCEARELPINVEEVSWAGFVNATVGKAQQITLQGRELNGRFAVSEIVAADDFKPSPPLPVDKLQPSGQARRFPHLRASWFWSPASWIDTPQRIFDSQTSLALKRIYITVPVSEGRVQHAEQLQQFLQIAHQHGLQVWAVLGDPYAVLDREKEHFLARVSAYQDFNTGNVQQRLDGLQLDIEPYLLPGYQLNSAVWLQKQAKIVNAAHQVASSLELDIVLPFWFDPVHGDSAALLSNVETSITSITLMNYRTDPGQIREFAEKFLDWGERRKKAVFIALESLAMPEEDRRVYKQAESGELWSFSFKETPVLLLLQQTQDLPGGKAYSFSHSRKVDGSNTSFSLQPNKLMGLLPVLEKQFGAWSSFAVLALHGQEQP